MFCRPKGLSGPSQASFPKLPSKTVSFLKRDQLVQIIPVGARAGGLDKSESSGYSLLLCLRCYDLSVRSVVFIGSLYLCCTLRDLINLFT